MFGLEVRSGIIAIDFSVFVELTETTFAGLNVELIFGVLRWRNKSNSRLQVGDMANSIFTLIDTLTKGPNPFVLFLALLHLSF